MNIKNLYIENTFFEEEITNPKKTLNELLFGSAHTLQLQFLPLLYADESDYVLVTHMPPTEYLDSLDNKPKLLLLNDLLSSKNISLYKPILWGPSMLLSFLFNNAYLYPPFEIVKKVHSKLFCFEHTKKLLGSTLIHNEREAHSYLQKTKKPFVFKTLYGRSGSGHFLIFENFSEKNLKSFLGKQFSHKRPVIAQPWVNRFLDFSTQWEITPDKILFIGKTIIENNAFGSYEKTHVNETNALLDIFFEEHLNNAKELLIKIQKEGFFGPIGIDAMIYEYEGKKHLHILEANCRKTMSLVALKIREKKKIEKLTLCFEKGKNGLLPNYLETPPKKHLFTKNLTLQIS